MDWLPENWTPVLNALRRGRRVVPVIGEALQLIPDEHGKPTPFVRILARRLFATYSEAERASVQEELRKKQSHAAEPSLHDLAVPFISRPMKFAERLRPLHEALLDEALAHLFPAVDPPVEQRHPLRLLAEIRGLPLYLTTTPDSLMKRVLARVRGMRDEDVRGFQLLREKPERATTADLRNTLSWDLPPGWDPSPSTRPFLYHLFGRIDDPDGSARFDVTEEDHFEMLCRLQSETWWPEQLMWELKPSHVLFLGSDISSLEFIMLLRGITGKRLGSQESSCLVAVIPENLTLEWSPWSQSSGLQNRAPSNGNLPLIFISAKSNDYAEAGKVFDWLMSLGANCFFAEKTLLQAGDAAYRKAIDDALEVAHHMVVVTSSRENVRGKWVEHEWGYYQNELLAGRKSGTLITLLCRNADIATMPPGLRSREFLTFESELQKLPEFLKGSIPADDIAKNQRALEIESAGAKRVTSFLDTFSENVRIVRDISTEQFVSRMFEIYSSILPVSTGQVAPSPNAVDLHHDGVFISYSNKDLHVAERLAADLRRAGLTVVLSQNIVGLEHGSDYDAKLQQNIQRAVFVLPLISAHTQGGGYFRREWTWACEKNTHYFGIDDRRYLWPIIIDGSKLSDLKAVPQAFKDTHILSLPDGKCTPAFLADLLAAFEKWRAKP